MNHTEASLSILNAARDLFAEKGYRNISTREIARCAGVNEVTLFRQFGTKLALYEAVFAYYGSTSDLFAAFEHRGASPEDSLMSYGLSIHRFFCNNEPLIRMEIKEQTFMNSGHLPVVKIANLNRQLLTEFLQRSYTITAAEAESVAISFLCSLWGIFMSTCIFNLFDPAPDVTRCIEQAVHSVISSLAPHKPVQVGMQATDSGMTHLPASAITPDIPMKLPPRTVAPAKPEKPGRTATKLKPSLARGNA